MRPIEPDMVLGKETLDRAGSPLGRVVDVGLYDHSRVKFLIVGEEDGSVAIRRVGVEDIAGVDAEFVRLSVR